MRPMSNDQDNDEVNDEVYFWTELFQIKYELTSIQVWGQRDKIVFVDLMLDLIVYLIIYLR